MSTHLKFAAFILLLSATIPIAVAQHHDNYRPDPNTNWAKVDTRPTWEQWATAEADVQIRPREEAGAVSVQQLRNPLKGKGRDLVLKAEKLLQMGKMEEATALLNKALEIPGARPYAYSMLGTEHLKMGLLDTAIEELQLAAQLLPGSSLIHNNLAYALAVKGSNARAQEEARKALQLAPDNASTRYIMGALLLDAGQLDEAVFHLKLAATKIEGARQMLANTLAKRNSQRRPQASPAMSFQTQAAGK